MIDLVLGLAPYLVGVAIVVVAFLMLKAVKELHTGYPDTEGFGIDDVAWAAVTAVEQMFFDKDGDFKLQEAMNFVGRFFPDVDQSELRMWIEAAVKQMNDLKKD